MTLTLHRRFTPPSILGRALAALALVAACSGDDATTDASAGSTDASASTTASTGESSGATASTAGTTAGTTDATATGTGTASGTTTEGTTAGTTAGTTEGTTAGTTATTDTGEPVGTCESDDGCKLVDSCCSCAAVPIDTPDEDCPGECFATQCTSLGLFTPKASCRLGVCAIAAERCDPIQVACDALPPECAPGFVASVVDACWGACIPAHFCDVLPSCSHELCGPGWMCVESQAGAFAPHCEPVPAACQGAPSCGCVGAEFSEVCQGGCEDGGGSLICADGG